MLASVAIHLSSITSDWMSAWVSAGYDALRRLAEDASKRGLLEADEDEDPDDDDDA